MTRASGLGLDRGHPWPLKKNRMKVSTNWQEGHRRKVDSFPEDVREAHKHSTNNRTELSTSTKCGCFCCCSIFNPVEVERWIDEDEQGVGQTAMCPRCEIDSVIGEQSGYPISLEFLKLMEHYWFNI